MRRHDVPGLRSVSMFGYTIPGFIAAPSPLDVGFVCETTYLG